MGRAPPVAPARAPSRKGPALNSADTIRRFFAEYDPARGPFSLLALEPEACAPAEVRAALRRRLDRLAQHPLGKTAEADEVRQALHVATAQLIDPAVRAELIADDLARRRAAVHPGAAGPPPVPVMRRAPAAAAPPLPQTAWHAYALAGGWTPRAIAMVGALSRGMPGVAIVVPPAAMPPPRAPDPGATDAPVDAPSPETVLRARRLRSWTKLLILAFCISASTLMARAIVALNSARGPAAAPESADPVEASAGAAQESAVRDAARPSAAPDAAPPASREPRIIPGPRAEIPPTVLPEPAVPEPVRRWASLMTSALREAPRTQSSRADQAAAAALHRAARLAHLNLAAGALWAGDSERSERAVRDAAALSTAPPSIGDSAIASRLTAPATDPDGRLASELLELRRKPAQIEELRGRRFDALTLGPADCDVVAEHACWGPSNEMRLLGRRIALEQRENPAMLYAVLEALPRAPRQPHVRELIQELTGRALPAPDEEAWTVAARTAVAERLTELLAAADQPGVDEAARQLALAYDSASARSSAPAEAAAEEPAPAPDPLDAATRLRERFASELSSLGVPDAAVLARRAEARRTLAAGPLAAFAAEQLSIAELLARIVRLERPGRAAAVDAALARAAGARRAAPAASAQIETLEALLGELWMHRLGADPPPPAPEASS
ncbi:MAG: hypothetical protein SFZ24_04920 [Planctomycetota bacterium]|nr:hypothetical protein [Planctomycetota bacterium]